ncbi:MarR family transcriptional regulator [Lentilactobacillus parafarraginis]|jgi:MarR family transcriptional regulator|uniref:Organic hydroperoxide resistance transcriptional regulator n=2 Tax=Lentilactobacillus parafarraginis TaxID=390842 RepID=A0A0R1YX06_9LACO|nr:MarR family transcriptional regulator [Lentilactobacillus parafarraginis]KRM43507.1 organic hydroperoxide resistance transcriptional regulator [Lentilactobacillus parafarraginis DSM 18390 = JCM 14109]TLQ20561.1 MarR family transcriptional regulator [Lentilactobacillus parafarraginis]
MQEIQPIRLDNQLCFRVYTANKKFNKFYQDALKPFDLTYPQYIALLTLWENAPMSVKKIGKHLHLDSGTLTPLLKRLESHGWITRTRSPQDERTVIIELTDMALNQRDKVFDRVNSCQNMLNLTNDQLEACMTALELLDEHLDAYNQAQKS